MKIVMFKSLLEISNLTTYSKENQPTKTASAISKKYSSSEQKNIFVNVITWQGHLWATFWGYIGTLYTFEAAWGPITIILGLSQTFFENL